MIYDKTKEHAAYMLISYERAITLDFLSPTEVGRCLPLPPEISAQSDPPYYVKIFSSSTVEKFLAYQMVQQCLGNLTVKPNMSSQINLLTSKCADFDVILVVVS